MIIVVKNAVINLQRFTLSMTYSRIVPNVRSEEVQRLITSAPTHAKGMLTPAGTSRRSSKEELRAKWREETPKLRKKLRDKLGEQYVKDIPSLNANFDD
ncbi:MAG: hypothetical protein Q9P01_12145 [Anaerolineae bacterium]|nr:hypothetical protein [Anaerolineae bacterium]